MRAPLRQFNWVEGVFWIALATVVLWRGTRGDRRRMGVIASLAAALALFGVSDFVETWSGAWWKPWWLLAWKGTCLAVIAACVAALVRGRRRR